MKSYLPPSPSSTRHEESFLHSPSPVQSGSLTPYMKSYRPASTPRPDTFAGASSHCPYPTSSSPVTPYTKSYHPASNPRDHTFAGPVTHPPNTHTSSQLTPYTKSYHPTSSSSPISSPSPHLSSSVPGSHSRTTSHSSPLPSSSNTQARASRYTPPSPSSPQAEGSILDTDPPPTFVSRNPDGRSEVGVGGPVSPTTTTRLMGIIDTMRQRLDAMEPPPAYATEIGGGASRTGGGDDWPGR